MVQATEEQGQDSTPVKAIAQAEEATTTNTEVTDQQPQEAETTGHTMMAAPTEVSPKEW